MMAMPATGADDGADIGAAPLEIERQQTQGRLNTIDRRLTDTGSRLIPVSPLDLGGRSGADVSGGVPPPDPLRSNNRRLDLERRGLEQRQQTINQALGRIGGDSNPSSGGLLKSLRGD